MEVENPNAAMLSNYEVLKLLNEYVDEQKKTKQTRSDQNLSTITYETLKYLNETPASVQNQDSIETAVKALRPFGLTKAEKLQMINLRPTTAVEISLIIEESEERVTEEQIDDIIEIISHLPELPAEETMEEEES
uniref:DNA-directed RNA polymerase III subunit RPC9 n=1 Tax=Phallusia mammillata TaxID=59560 RepID=A0A6F9D9E8_9ASCI|nr:CGRP-RCP calcitonin gene-related peptide receptor component protein [Phallusia mammillata]